MGYMSQGVYVLGGKCPGGKCPGGKCPGGICPWGKCPGGTCRGGGGYVLEPVFRCGYYSYAIQYLHSISCIFII